MSDAEKRQTRQRALTIGACAAVVALGAPLIGQRFQHQKTEEAYRADAIVLAHAIATESQASTKLVSFTNKADPSAVAQPVSYAASAGDMLGGLTLRARDDLSLRGMMTFDLDALEKAGSNKSELDCLSQAVYYEARSEDTLGQMAVAEVIMNRVHDSRFPKTICAVVYQGQYRDTGCQFTFTCDGSLAHKPSGEAWDRARDIAFHVALGLNKPVTNHATHYHTDYVNPYWKAGMVETAELGAHIFYRFPKSASEWQVARAALAAQGVHGDDVGVPGLEGPGLLTVDAPKADIPAVIAAPAGVSIIPISTEAPAATPVPPTQVADARPL